jgi:hypothetical protein
MVLGPTEGACLLGRLLLLLLGRLFLGGFLLLSRFLARHLEAPPPLWPAQALANGHGRLAFSARIIRVDVHRAPFVHIHANDALGLQRRWVVLAKGMASQGRLRDGKNTAGLVGAIDLGVAAKVGDVLVLAGDDERKRGRKEDESGSGDLHGWLWW